MDRDSFTSRFAGMDTRRGGLVSWRFSIVSCFDDGD